MNFKEQYVPWRGIFTIMQGGWRCLPIRLGNFRWEDYDKFKGLLMAEIKNALTKYKISEVDKFSILCDGTITAKIKK